jgi:hypothetical protein
MINDAAMIPSRTEKGVLEIGPARARVLAVETERNAHRRGICLPVRLARCPPQARTALSVERTIIGLTLSDQRPLLLRIASLLSFLFDQVVPRCSHTMRHEIFS